MVLVRGVEPPFTRSSFQTKRSVDRGSSDCFHGLRFFNLGLQPLHPSMHDDKAVPSDSQCGLAEYNTSESLSYDWGPIFDVDSLFDFFPERLACLICFCVFILIPPSNHCLAFFVPDLGGRDLLQSRLFEPWHEDFEAFCGLNEVKLHITLVWEGFDSEVDQCWLSVSHLGTSFVHNMKFNL